MSYVYYGTNKSHTNTYIMAATQFAGNRSIIRIDNTDLTNSSTSSIYTTVQRDVFADVVGNFISDEAKSVTIQGADSIYGSKDYIRFDNVRDGFKVTIGIDKDKCSCFINLDNLNNMLNHFK